jgi:hypothetical protein
MKYSRDFDGRTFSIRIGIIGIFRLTARSISRSTCGDLFAWSENTKTITRAQLIASMIDPPQLIPGRMSRGATQQRIPLCSNTAQVASAVSLSLEE